MININLLPKELKLRISQSKKSANIFSLCLVAIVVVLFICFALYEGKNYMQMGLDSVKKDISVVNSSLSSFDKLEKEALFVNDRVALAKKIETNHALWSIIVQNLINSVPENVQFVSLNADLSKTPNITLQGKTGSERDAIKFKEKLESSDYFKDVNFKSASMDTATTATPDQPAATPALSFTLEFNVEKLSPTATSQGASK